MRIGRFKLRTPLRLLLLVLTLITAFFGGPFFLISFFSISGREKLWTYTGRNTSLANLDDAVYGSLPDRFQFMLRSTTRRGDLNSEQLSLHSTLFIEPKTVLPSTYVAGSEDSYVDDVNFAPRNLYVHDDSWKEYHNLNNNALECPPNFELALLEGRWLCAQHTITPLKFLQFTKEDIEEDEEYRGSCSVTQTVSRISVNLAGYDLSKNTFMRLRMLDFGAESDDAGGQPPYNTHCSSPATAAEECADFFSYLTQNGSAPYAASFLFPDCSARRKGDPKNRCAAVLALGGQECATKYSCSSENQMCLFALYYLMLPHLSSLPKLWTEISTWGVLVFISSIVSWLFVALYHGRKLHLNYLKYYYVGFNSDVFDLEPSIYDFKLVFTGDRFTNKRGEFLLRDNSGGVVFQWPFRVQFEEEDYEGSQGASKLVRGSFKCTSKANGVCFDVVWDDAFHMADFQAPSVQIVMRRRVPFTVKTRANVIFLPLFFLLSFWNRSKFIRYREYVYLALYFSFVHLALIITICYNFLMYIDSAERLMWGTSESRPFIPPFFYSLFLFSLASAWLLTLVPYCRGVPKPKRRRTNKSLPKESNAYLIESSTRPHLPKRPTSHWNVDYISLDDMSGSVGGDANTTSDR